MQKVILLILSAMLLAPQVGKAAEPPLSFSLFNQSWAFPLSPIFRLKGPLHPGISIGTEFSWRKRNRNQWIQAVELGGYWNQAMGSALYLGTEARYRRYIKTHWMAEAGLGLGYFHNFSPRNLITQSAEGTFVAKPDNGKPGSLISLSLATGRTFLTESKRPITLFARYQWMAASPFTDIIPIRPTGLFHIGLRFTLSTPSS